MGDPLSHPGRRWLTAALALLCFARGASAQRVSGTIIDGQSRLGLPGVVLSQLDADGRTLARTLSGAGGRYSLAMDANARTVRVVRLGYVARDLTLGELASGEIVMQRIPQSMLPLRVEAKECSALSGNSAAVALLDQARAGLLSAVVSRTGDPVSAVRLRYERRLNDDGDHDGQKVRIDSAANTHRTFVTAPTGSELAERGFLEEKEVGLVLHGPDADVFLDDGFVNAYCFRVARANRARPREVGLEFAPARRARDRIDIEGTVWVDTAARELRQIQFRYLGLPRDIERREPGGEVGFLTLANGLVLVDRWRLRLVGITHDTLPPLPGRRDAAPVVRNRLHVMETGGEVASVGWGEHAYEAPLGTLDLLVQTADSQPAVGAQLWLEDTDYATTIDSSGRARIPRLLPGRYSLLAYDSTTVPIDLPIPTGVRFEAHRDSVHAVALVMPTAESYMRDRCGVRQLVRTDTVPWILGRIRRADGGLIEPGIVRAKKEVRNGTWEPVTELFRVESDGLFWICSRELAHEKDTILEYQIRSGRRHELRLELRRDLNIVPFDIEP